MYPREQSEKLHAKKKDFRSGKNISRIYLENHSEIRHIIKFIFHLFIFYFYPSIFFCKQQYGFK